MNASAAVMMENKGVYDHMKMKKMSTHQLTSMTHINLQMGCECGDQQSMIIDSRVSPMGYRWRRKKCWKCGKKYSTVEINASVLNELEEKMIKCDKILETIEIIKEIKGQNEKESNDHEKSV